MEFLEESNDDVKIRNMSFDDINKIIELQKESFPSMLKEGSVWRETHLKSHIQVFPEGQFCAEYKDKIIGSSSSLITTLKPEYATHTFAQATANSMFTNHDYNGDSLYGADISIHPSYRRLGIATLLYNVRKNLVMRRNLRRIIAGGRLYNYYKYANKVSPDEYAKMVVNKEISDPVLTFQLQNGFNFIKILPNYIKDARSLNYATFIEWVNPYYKN